MPDYDALSFHRVVARYNGIVADTTGPLGDPGTAPDLYTPNCTATMTLGLARNGKRVRLTPELRLTGATPPRTLLLLPVRANIESGVLRLPGADPGVDGVDVVAKSDVLGIGTDDLIATWTFGEVSIGGSVYTFDPVSYVVPTIQRSAYKANEVQVVTLTGAPTAGTWALTYGGSPTMMFPPNAPALTVQNALRAIVPGNHTVAGNAGGPYTVTFDLVAVPRPYPLGKVDALTGGSNPGVKITDNYTPTTVDLTTVARWTEAA